LIGRYGIMFTMRFGARPWQERAPLSDEQLAEQIARDIARNGFWTKTGEFRMGGGPTVWIRPSQIDGAFQVSATCGISLSGEYESLDAALAAGLRFVDVVWELIEEGKAHQGLIWPPVE
jgi:hypothetical protein